MKILNRTSVVGYPEKLIASPEYIDPDIQHSLRQRFVVGLDKERHFWWLRTDDASRGSRSFRNTLRVFDVCAINLRW